MRLRPLLLTTTALMPIVFAPALAGPEGGTVVGGAATISGQGSSHVIVNQSSQNAIVNWNTFNLGTGDRAQFIQPWQILPLVIPRLLGHLLQDARDIADHPDIDATTSANLQWRRVDLDNLGARRDVRRTAKADDEILLAAEQHD